MTDRVLIQREGLRVLIYEQMRFPDNPETPQIEMKVSIVRGSEDITMTISEFRTLTAMMVSARELLYAD